MNSKLDDAVIQRCIENCMRNEILVVPESAKDVGQDEYFTLKARTLWRKASLRVPFEKSAMALRFPSPDDSRKKVDEFFDSPRDFMNNMAFTGCFAIDISAYRDSRARESSYFRELKSFMASEKGIVFLLLVRTDRKSEVAELVRSLDDEVQLRQVTLARPTSERLLQYTSEALGLKFRDSELEKLFRTGRDFQTADRFIDYVGESQTKDPVDSISSYLSTYRVSAGRSEMGY